MLQPRGIALCVALLTIAWSSDAIGGSDDGTFGPQLDGSHLLYNPEYSTSDDMGRSVAISGNYAVVGAPMADSTGFNDPRTGNAWIYEYVADPNGDGSTDDAEWTLEANLGQLLKDWDWPLETDNRFGYCVDIDGDRAIVSAPGIEQWGDVGNVFVFRNYPGVGWLAETVLPPFSPHEFGGFATSVSISGQVIFAGDPNWPGGGGFWYWVLGRNDQRPTLVLPPEDRGDSNRGIVVAEWGRSICADGDILMIGGPGTSSAGIEFGAVWVYRMLPDFSFVEEAWLLPLAIPWWGVADTRFGTSLAADGTEYAIAIGGPNPNGDADTGGMVMAYRKIDGAWTFESLLEDDPPVPTARFGESVAIDNNRIVVGAPKANDVGDLSGHATVFEYSPSGGAWFKETRLVNYPESSYDNAGTSVSISGDSIIVGSPFDSIWGVQSGSVHAYHPQLDGEWQLDTRLTYPVQLDAGQLESPLGEPAANRNRSLAISNNIALVGDHLGTNPARGTASTGRVHVYLRAGNTGPWVLDPKHEIPIPAEINDGDSFGFSVAISGNVAVVGAPRIDDDISGSGSAWLFQRDSTTGDWSAGIRIVQSGPLGFSPDHVGTSVAIDEADGYHLVAVGAPGEVSEEETEGVVKIFGWSEDSGLWFDGLLTGTFSFGYASSFGSSVDINFSSGWDAIVAVGDPTYPGYGDMEGGVLLFHRTGTGDDPIWNTMATLSGSDWQGAFGQSLDLDGSLLAIGDPDAYEGMGAVHVYRRDGQTYSWNEEDMFGYNLKGALGTDVQIMSSTGYYSRLLVGAPESNYLGINTGGIVSYVYEQDLTQWQTNSILLPRTPVGEERIGQSLALSSQGTRQYLLTGGTGDMIDNDELRILDFRLDKSTTFSSIRDDAELSFDAFWTVPPWQTPNITAVFSLLLAEPHSILFDTLPWGTTWIGSWRIEFDDITVNLPGPRAISQNVEVAGDAPIRSAILQTEGSPLTVHGNLDVGHTGSAGQLVLRQHRIVMPSGKVTLGPESAFKPILSNGGDPRLHGESNSTCQISSGSCELQGCLAVELGDLDPDSLEEGDRWVLVASNSTPPEGDDRFAVAVLPSISDTLAFQLQYTDSVTRHDGEDRGTWEVAIEVVNLSDLLAFDDANTTAVNANATAVQVVDLNNDGAEEICVTFDGTPGQLVIFENDGVGGVAQQIVVNTGDEPVDITSGDFDGDGNQDLAVANHLSQDISVYLNDDADPSDGFTAADFSPGVIPTCLAGFDYLNIDNLDDLVIGYENAANPDGGFIIFAASNPLRAFGFGGQQNLATSGVPVGVDPAEDEKDKGIPFGGSKNNGYAVGGRVSGALTAAGPVIVLDDYPAGADLRDVLLSDVNGDSLPDLVVSSAGNNAIALLLQNTAIPGTFDPALQIPAGTEPGSLAAIDFNEDGNMDLASVTTDLAGNRIVRVLQNDGSLSFTSLDLAEGEFPLLVDAGDIDGNGTNDLVTIGDGGGSLLRGPSPLLALRATEALCDCSGDADCNGTVDVEDLLGVIADYGCTRDCVADVTDDGLVDVEDVLAIISGWGDCS